MKLKPGRRSSTLPPNATSVSEAHRHRADARRRGPALCPSNADRLQDPRAAEDLAACGAASSLTSRWCRAGLEFALELRGLLLARKPGVVAVELAGISRRRLPASAGAAAGNVGDPLSRSEDDDERAIYVPVEPCDPFTEAVRTADEIGAEVIFLEPDSARTSASCPTPIRTPYAIARIGLDATSKPIACIRRPAPRK